VAGGPDIAFVLRPRRDPGPVLDAVGNWAATHGSRLLMRAEDAARAWDGDVAVVSDAELAERADVVSPGGDGAMLGALRLPRPECCIAR
jgi:NAD+ kinase